ncbi:MULTISPECIES: hypothetical protein [unclassified Mesorhizobium]|uniref:hypothetical protein n=1 Tax=unclassified Mesorhizobium TaxID=325217 RepID=UPI000FE35121|nr:MULTISPECIES: hypothetical protein [unclassified Mesorhizobium]MDG4895184.1 hypothetical protein [Mesorhizobium sp. WSM4976]RWH68119.1 MAG: hypothetical protein EOQ84_26500 [Mesorhizobium sp.]RWL23921.1 MAG: hypothetical protein EOR58_24905 [Mesorhizobium sp.]RWL27083.1 MAG: hypothetical protein EOR63_24050 [Mesorhizobium sp.]RWL35384.1 MAG: hypothetical protein EOR59_22640 [Mesorhizobium sp.]
MNTKILCMSALAFSLATGAAMASSAKGTSALDDPQKMSPFFTDAGMKTMRSGDEFKKAWLAMSEEDRTSIKKDCGDEAIAKQHDNFCKMTKELGGAN